jgi:phosphoglycolate phosphatase-like HAD superfamily hydrolase
MGGMTDRAIVRAGLRAIGHGDELHHIDALSAAYLAALPREVAASPSYRVLPGVVALIDALARLSNVALGLGTGNVEPGARIKLQRGGLADRFAFGGFGCDGEARADLVAAGIARGLERLRVMRSACRVVVVGDTPADVAAALHNGAECLAVATGSHGAEQLAAAGATKAVADLADAGVAAWLVG